MWHFLCIKQLLYDYFIRSATHSFYFSSIKIKVCDLTCHSTSSLPFDIIIRDSYQNHFARKREDGNYATEFVWCTFSFIRAFGLITQNLIMSKIGSKSLAYWCTHTTADPILFRLPSWRIISVFYCISGK